MYKIIVLLACLCVCTYTAKSPQLQRCDVLNSVVNRDQRLNLFVCTVGQGCFSLDCQHPLTNSDFQIFIEPCKHPAAILVNASFMGSHYSHEFTHTETVNLPNPTGLSIAPKLSVILDNSDSKVLVFSIVVSIGTVNYTIVPETRFPLNNITCIDGHIATFQHTSPTSPTPYTSPCIDTCGAVHDMVKRTSPLCQSTSSCLTINCNSPKSPSFSLLDITSSYTIMPCEQPPVVQARLDDNTNNNHIVRNFTQNTTFTIQTGIKVQITLVDVNQYSILFGVHLLLGFGSSAISIPILQDQVIPIDRSHCSWYTGPSANPLCATTTMQSTQTPPHNSMSSQSTQTPPHNSMSSPSPSNHRTTPLPHFTTSTAGPAINASHARPLGIATGAIAGIVLGILLTTLLIVAASVSVTLFIVLIVYKKKSKSVYSYSQFRALEEDD